MIPSSAIIKGELSSVNKTYYQQQGFLVAPNLLSEAEIDSLKEETACIFRGGRGNIEGLLEAGKEETDRDLLKRYIAIHFPHKLSPVIKEFLFQPLIVKILQGIVSPNLKCMQSMLFVKAPGKKGQAWHQDEFYIPTRDRSLIGVWIAIDDATIENGCLWIIPGKPGAILRRTPSDSPEFADVDTVDVSAWKEQSIPVEVKAGSVVFFHGYTLHSSLKNKTTDCFRTALVNHYMSAESMLPWDQDGKLQATEDLRDIVMIAGKDPYGWKGTIDVNQPYLRPEVLKIKTNDTI